MATGLFVDAKTGEKVERELTQQELDNLVEPEAARIARLTAEAEANRRSAFTAEADPLYFKWQRGESTEQEWLDKIAEIRKRFPNA